MIIHILAGIVVVLLELRNSMFGLPTFVLHACCILHVACWPMRRSRTVTNGRISVTFLAKFQPNLRPLALSSLHTFVEQIAKVTRTAIHCHLFKFI